MNIIRVKLSASASLGLLALLSLVSCSSCTAARSATVHSAAWRTHKDPAGFQVTCPAGWTSQMESNARVVIRASRAEFIVIQPLFRPDPPSAQDWVESAPRLMPSVFPGAKVTKSAQHQGEALATYQRTVNGVPVRTDALCSIHGPAGMFYGISAPASRFLKAKPELMRILSSFRYTTPQHKAVKSAAPSISYTKWVDPKEHAFTIEIPRGWHASGGLYRFASVDVRPCITVSSPDGAIELTAGDKRLPTFTTPMPYLREGSNYSPGYGVVMKVLRYVPGEQFATAYVKQRFPGASILASHDRADAARKVNAVYREYRSTGITPHLTTGDVRFTSGGKDGYYFAGTTMVSSAAYGMPGGLWYVEMLYGYKAPPKEEKLAETALGHLVGTYRVNADWARMQQGIAANTSQIVTKTNEAISSMISEPFQNASHAMDEAMRNWSNYMRGEVDVRDPDTGEKFKAVSGHDYYWRKEGSNTIIGTNTYDPPDVNFTPLKQW